MGNKTHLFHTNKKSDHSPFFTLIIGEKVKFYTRVRLFIFCMFRVKFLFLLKILTNFFFLENIPPSPVPES